MKLGCIGDDFTGSSDLANTLAKGGMVTRQYVGIPTVAAQDEVDAGVVSLKTRSLPAPDAVNQSLRALEWLKQQGCIQFLFKYCSTFDSTREGNIGPVADALADALEATRVIVCPAFPKTGRSIYQGHLFVGDKLLSQSGMQDHPLNPMTDSDIRRWLGHQTRHEVGHVNIECVTQGEPAILAALDREHESGKRLIVVDAIRDEDLIEIGAACKSLKLITGGSGIAIGLPKNFGCSSATTAWRPQTGKAAAISGSCSSATREQVVYHGKTNPVRKVEASEVIENRVTTEEFADWVISQSGVPLVYSSTSPEEVQSVQNAYGREVAATSLDAFFGDLATRLVDRGVTRLISAGGETSGAIVGSLKLHAFEIGPEIDPGVPALRASEDLVVALKSGNFGAVDFFEKAAEILGHV